MGQIFNRKQRRNFKDDDGKLEQALLNMQQEMVDNARMNTARSVMLAYQRSYVELYEDYIIPYTQTESPTEQAEILNKLIEKLHHYYVIAKSSEIESEESK